jgi:hypothetical protein
VTFVGEKGRLTLERGGFKADPADLAVDPAAAAAERFTNSAEANRFLARPYRAGYTLPDQV